MNSLFTPLPEPPRLASGLRRAGRCAGSVWLAVCLVAGVLAGWAQPAAGRPAVSKEYQIKAAFLYNFTKFVEWPAERREGASHPLVIGVLGANPFGHELERLVHNRRVNGREIAIMPLASSADARRADVVFISAGEIAKLEETLDVLHDAGVLTVGESPAFAAAGGIITFGMEGDKIRFAINLQSGERASLKISAQLLKLASSVRQ